jgi:lipopolysaccharide transport system ATP-binding protein
VLKVLSRITEPTYGTVKLRGRVGSLLEVGTGFHPELTGRENIYLNGAVLGMARSDIKKKFDEIVAFAEVDKFLDTPVKRFSSGMYVRLAFAVAAHLESEILILDEVLAVGDVEFQKKCLGKIGEVVSSGRAALIVSHNLQTIVSLCSRAIVMDHGILIRDGSPDAVVSSYLSRGHQDENHVLFRVDRDTAGTDVTSVELLDENGRAKSSISTFDFIRFRVGLSCREVSPQGSVILEIKSSLGFTVLKVETHPSDIKPLGSQGDHWIDCCIESLPLAPGHYLLSVGLAVYGVCLLSWRADVANLVVAAPPGFQQAYGEIGSLAVRHRWSQSPGQDEANYVGLDI